MVNIELVKDIVVLTVVESNKLLDIASNMVQVPLSNFFLLLKTSHIPFHTLKN
ncbi:hypothetical protein SDC9_205495 [bioreactor metagenome]|uniref:Uncharacterized protein n=1 Tax=bioreactor metagenome TaxID=1076179 RepID=A0A645J2I8_9ZZZZ